MKITVYSTTTCPYCIKLKHWLEEKNIEFTEYMVDRNPYAAQAMISISGQRGVPFSTIEHEDGSMDKIIGFDRGQFEAVLAK
ncbi:glutaredoxin family protein [Candidatus Saccharibacteria bacterium]|nr:glutaredoxin family protein [Candidatus Saccharibacteria bacterium]